MHVISIFSHREIQLEISRMSFWLTRFHFLTLSFLLVQSHICVCYYNSTVDEEFPQSDSNNNNSALHPRAIADRSPSASLVLVDDIAIAACQTVWLNKLHRATYGSPTDIPFLLPPQFPATNVSLEIKLISLAQISPSVILIGISILPTWYDPRFGWDSKLDCPLTSVHLRSNKIWRPSFTLSDPIKTHTIAAVGLPLAVAASSRVSFSNAINQEVNCFLSARLFPYDQQHCRIVIKAENGNGIEDSSSVFWNFDAARDLNLGELLSATVAQTNWQVNGIYGKISPENDGHLILFFRLERRNNFAFNLWLITSVFLTLLVCSSLGLEPSSVEKMVTSFLAVVGYLGHLMLLLQILPVDLNTDSTVPVLLDFSLIQFVIGVSAVGLNGIVVNIWYTTLQKMTTAKEANGEHKHSLMACCNNLSHGADDSGVKINCLPSTSCIEDFATITNCKSGNKKCDFTTCRVFPASDGGRLVSTDPITVTEKGSISVMQGSGNQFCTSPRLPEQGRTTRKCQKWPKNWLQKTLLVGYFMTMLFVYAAFVVVMVISIAQAKASSPVDYSTPF